ncbi:aldo/keto reductase [Anaerofustis sp. NSJ-163]|uniref:aldo/keto reductase n=1 Tax=Anaerofustis sp. NSJ-163 TaxID=2944391 RepID=UPI00209C532C|nr:aldo/keto reductase [Anaerofustis sp. NSJ-163]MCO8194486.1 aldo/keto reductase [Anaerofustis sp. NSJ-163]
MENFKLTNGTTIPKIGFGTYKAGNGNCESAVIDAINSGYTYFDTAAFYKNENDIAKAIKNSNVKREDLIIASKVWREDLGYDETMKAFEKSLKELNTDYLDVYLIHWPKENPFDVSWKQKDIKTWKAMEELYKAGRIKVIGVSNFLPHHLINLMENCEIKPMVNQIESHIGYLQKTALDFCVKNDILVQAWSPLGRGRVLGEESLTKMAEKYGKTVPQLCIRFLYQLGIMPIIKSSSTYRMKENLDIFDFSIERDDMYYLMCLPQIGWSGEHPDRQRVYFD